MGDTNKLTEVDALKGVAGGADLLVDLVPTPDGLGVKGVEETLVVPGVVEGGDVVIRGVGRGGGEGEEGRSQSYSRCWGSAAGLKSEARGEG